MHSRIIMMREVLKFDQFDVHVGGKKYQKDIQEAEKLVDELLKSNNNNTDPEDIKFLCKQIAIYYLFYKREEQSTLKYLELISVNIKKDTLEEAEFLNFMGHAHTINPDKNDVKPLVDALKILNNLPPSNDPLINIKIQINKAFALRYIALMHHRKKEMEKAKQNINDAIKIEREIVSQSPAAKIVLAESLHILGVISLREKKYEDATKAFEEAAKLEEEFSIKSGERHFLVYTTQQSIAQMELVKENGDYGKAAGILEGIYKPQVDLFGTEKHPDVAKTLQFLAETYNKLGKYPQALDMALKTLAIKLLFNKESDPIVKFARDAINVALKQLRDTSQFGQFIIEISSSFDFDWNNYKTFPEAERNIGKIFSLLEYVTKDDIDSFSNDEKLALGQLYYKVGTYFVHLQNDEVTAAKMFEKARAYLQGIELDWVIMQDAFCIQKMMAKEKSLATKIDYFNHGTKTLDEITCNIQSTNIPTLKLLAFRNCLGALFYYEQKEYYYEGTKLLFSAYKDSIAAYEKAMKIYRYIAKLEHPERRLDDQGAHALNRLAMIRNDYAKELSKCKMYDEANKVRATAVSEIAELEVYWFNHPDKMNIYAGRFFKTAAEIFANSKNNTDLEYALSLYKKAVAIFIATEGESKFTDGLKAKIATLQNIIATNLVPGAIRDNSNQNTMTLGTRATVPSSVPNIQQLFIPKVG